MAEPFEGWVDDPDVIQYAIDKATGWDKYYLRLYLGWVLERMEVVNDEVH